MGMERVHYGVFAGIKVGFDGYFDVVRIYCAIK